MAVTETQIMGRGSGARSTIRTQRQCERARGVAKFTVQVELTRVEMVQPHPCMALAFQGVPNPCLTPHRDHHNRKPRDWLCCSLPCRKGIPVRTCCAQTAQHWKAEISSLVAKRPGPEYGREPAACTNASLSSRREVQLEPTAPDRMPLLGWLGRIRLALTEPAQDQAAANNMIKGFLAAVDAATRSSSSRLRLPRRRRRVEVRDAGSAIGFPSLGGTQHAAREGKGSSRASMERC
ncbi:predicted protein [Chaetomium globosum CBS 148.51]|uniref:Uncharacterized protein n=1 Tax=Chaetomium globosum (strain ATCC 6205 / CBS 148.51 / DSM 1962 / NBRC 6347 / NRRL 1970) TaxID=306901 RepID=Q2H7H0_CHAGB|nr:uncharacterized protein CHGG_05395 [Chaetomium globosum CBS 148.51]EAQ88776.1 predicted protein [Chaetomium globosum CBS 148.51]